MAENTKDKLQRINTTLEGSLLFPLPKLLKIILLVLAQEKGNILISSDLGTEFRGKLIKIK